MLKSILLLFSGIILLKNTNGQQADTSALLKEVMVRAYEQNRSLREVGAPVTVVGDRQLRRSGNNSLVPAINMVPGVRMEERSPGSYRLNIRGSSLRSPFGVRNVKVYLNGIPFTDPGGNTYFNQLSFFDVAGIEILKGPGSSIYGAGTGGVMLVNTMADSVYNGALLNYSKGSFNTDNISGGIQWGNTAFQNKFSYSHQSSDGYRDHSSMRRDVASWQTRIQNGEKQTLSAYVLFGDLYYKTPGGLTRAQYLANPKAARPATPSLPSATDNQAAIYQKTFWAGVQQQYRFSDHLNNTTSLYGAFSRIKNPAILNYERRSEPHFGGRTHFDYTAMLRRIELKITAGMELQQGYFSIKVYKNNRGNSDSLRTDDEVNNRQLSFFTQASLSFPGGWIATAGISLNKTSVRLDRLSSVPAFTYNTSFSNEYAPRISLLKKIGQRASVYGVVSKGFSPPTVAELLSSTSVINTGLEAEEGINYEAGMRGSFIRNRLTIDLSAFYFGLRNAITQRRDQSGADFFVNAGDTRQKGFESALSYQLAVSKDHFISNALLWANYTFYHFRYKTFKQGVNDFSGNPLPGVAPNTLTAGIDLATRPGIYVHLHYFYSDRIALNDAGAEHAASYQLPAFRAGYKKQWGAHIITDLFIAGDNLANEKYSLGNDINAAGSRFYNAAPGFNYQAGIRVQLQ